MTRNISNGVATIRGAAPQPLTYAELIESDHPNTPCISMLNTGHSEVQSSAHNAPDEARRNNLHFKLKTSATRTQGNPMWSPITDDNETLLSKSDAARMLYRKSV